LGSIQLLLTNKQFFVAYLAAIQLLLTIKQFFVAYLAAVQHLLTNKRFFCSSFGSNPNFADKCVVFVFEN